MKEPNNIMFSEDSLLSFIKVKKAAKLEFLQMIASLICIAAAFISFILYKSLVTAFLVGAALLLSACIAQRTAKQLIEIIDNLIDSNADSFEKKANLILKKD